MNRRDAGLAQSEERVKSGSRVEAGDRFRSGATLDRLFRTALYIIPIGVIGNIAFSLLVTDRDLLIAATGFPRGYLAVALILGVLPWLTNTLRLQIWTRFLGHRMRFRSALQVVLATDLGSAVSPTAVGGGFFKWGMLVQRGMSPGTAASLSALTPLEDGIFFAIAIPLAILWTASWENPVFSTISAELKGRALPLLVLTLLVGLVTWMIVRFLLDGHLGRAARVQSRRFMGRLWASAGRNWRDAREVYRLIRVDGKLWFAASMLLTAVQWIARYSIISFLVAFLGVPVQPVLFWLLQWVVFTLAALIPTPGAAGGAEAAFFIIYGAFLPPEVIALATAGWRFFTFYLLLGIAAIGYVALSFRYDDSRQHLSADV